MVEGGCNRKYDFYWRNVPISGVICLFTMVVMYVQHGNALEDIGCSSMYTCETCTNQSSCNWSLEQQMCVNQTTGSLLVASKQNCPMVQVVKKLLYYDYVVKLLSTDPALLEFIKKSEVKCCSDNNVHKAVIHNYMILCLPALDQSSMFNGHAKAVLDHFHIEINDKQLKFDDDSDNWLVRYDKKCNENIDEDCVTCSWAVDTYKYYLKWCSDRNKCMGALELLQKRDRVDYRKAPYTIEPNVHIKCANVKIGSIEPLSGPWTGGTKLKIKVKYHRILSTNKTMTVSVAGRQCVDPRMVDDETIICTVALSVAEMTLDEGPVQVTYIAEFRKYTLQPSNQIFKFVRPVIYEFNPDCVSGEGGTILTVTGRYLNAGADVRVSIGKNVTCETISREPNRIQCRTTPSHEPMDGPVMVEFDQSMTILSWRKLLYAVVPTLTNDLGYLIEFGGVASGGTTVPFHATHLSCVNNASMYVVDPVHGNRHYTACTVKNDSYMVCQAPTVHLSADDNVANTPELNFGFQMNITSVRDVDLSPQSGYLKYSLYRDPVFEYFQLQNESVVINGQGFGSGYLDSDLSIRFQNLTADCVVVMTTRDRIVCESSSPMTVLDDLNTIFVILGKNLRYKVNRKHRSHVVDPMRLSSVSCAFIVISVITVFVCIILFTFKTMGKTCNASSQVTPTELRTLDK